MISMIILMKFIEIKTFKNGFAAILITNNHLLSIQNCNALQQAAGATKESKATIFIGLSAVCTVLWARSTTPFSIGWMLGRMYW